MSNGILEQIKMSGNRISYEPGSLILDWMKPILWRFSYVGKKTLQLIKRLKRKNVNN